MPRTKYTIDGREFATKKAVLDFVKSEIHGAYPEMQDISPEHLRFMVGLLRHHPWSDQKIGVGIARMWLQKNREFPTRGFWLERIDGTKTDFSFYQCVQPASPLRDFKAACRRSIAPQIIHFRQQFFRDAGCSARCVITGDEISLHDSHVDHAPPNTFDEIVSRFIGENPGVVESSSLHAHVDGCESCRFQDAEFEAKWIAFHDGLASLRVISVEANLSVVKKEI